LAKFGLNLASPKAFDLLHGYAAGRRKMKFSHIVGIRKLTVCQILVRQVMCQRFYGRKSKIKI